MRTIVAIFAVPLVAATLSAGCARPVDDIGTPVAGSFEDRAQAVADAWASSAAANAWRTGFVPLENFTIAPASGFPNDGTKQAFATGWYRLHGTLPKASVPEGVVRFPDGTTLNMPVVSAQEAYAAIDQGDPACATQPSQSPAPGTASTPAPCGVLTVTGATLGTATLRTSRGDATVPAWLFTVAELREPVARVAVAASAVTPVPTPSMPEPLDGQRHVGAHDITAIDGNQLTYRLGVGACDTGITPLVYETEDVVVVGGSVIPASGICISMLKLQPVTVTLSAPVGSRPVVDVNTGQALGVVKS